MTFSCFSSYDLLTFANSRMALYNSCKHMKIFQINVYLCGKDLHCQ